MVNSSSEFRAVHFSAAPAMPRHTKDSASGDIRVSRTQKYSQHRHFIHTHRVFHLDVLGSVAAWSPSGRLAQCQRLKGHVPGVVAEDVEMHEQPLGHEQLSVGEEKDCL